MVVLVIGGDVEVKERRLGMLGGEREFVCRRAEMKEGPREKWVQTMGACSGAGQLKELPGG